MIQYPLRFKAAILEGVGKPLAIDEVVFRGPLEEGQLLVRLFYSGICGKQIDEITGKTEDPFLPHLLGHEGSAEVLEVGPLVTKAKAGNKVVLHWRKGKGINSQTPLYYRNGLRVNAGWVTTFNEYAVVSENRVTVIPDDSDMLIASLMGCAVTTGVGAVTHVANITKEDIVVVYGCGGVGLCAVQAAYVKNPKRLIAIDTNNQSLKLAREFGATDVFNPLDGDIKKEIIELTDNKGASKVLVCVGNIKAIEEAIKITSIPGNTYIVGVPPQKEDIKINAYAVMHERNIIGTLGGASIPDRDIPMCFKMQQTGQLDIQSLISYVVPFDQINEIIKKIMKGDIAGRCVLKF